MYFLKNKFLKPGLKDHQGVPKKRKDIIHFKIR